MTSEPKYHHYISQCYLRGFLPINQKKPKLTVFDLKEKKCFLSGTTRVGGEYNFNRIALEGLDPNALEKELSHFESKVATALQDISVRQEFGDDATFEVLMQFIALLAMRNPAMCNSISDFLARVSNLVGRMILATRERYEHAVDRLKADGIPIDDSVPPYEEMRAFFESGKYTIQTPNETHAAYELRGAEAILPCLVERGWSFITASDETGPFITCDRPVCLRWKHPEELPPLDRCNPGFGMEDTLVLFPVSSKLALLGECEESRRFHTQEKYVANLNSLIITNARRWIYAPDLSFHFLDSGGTKRAGIQLLDCLTKPSS